jgi:uroporphyrinogen-III synthase
MPSDIEIHAILPRPDTRLNLYSLSLRDLLVDMYHFPSAQLSHHHPLFDLQYPDRSSNIVVTSLHRDRRAVSD